LGVIGDYWCEDGIFVLGNELELILNQDCLWVKLNFWVFSCEIKVNKIFLNF
jgi:hypothetical protein